MKKIILITIAIMVLNVQGSLIEDIKEKTSNVWEKTKEIAYDVKESNTTKKITSSTKEAISSVGAYLKPDENQSGLDKTKQIGNEALEFVKDTYKEIVK